MLNDHVIDDSLLIFFAIAWFIVIPASACFLTETPQLAQQICSFGVGNMWFFYVTTFTDIPTNIIPCQITHTEWSHRKAKFFNSFIDLLRSATFFQQETSLTTVLFNHAITNEAVANTRDNTCLFDLLGNTQHCCENIVRRLFATYDL